MPHRNFRPSVGVAGVPAPDSVAAALALLQFLGTVKGRETTEALLKSLGAAVKANTEALAGFGGAAHIVQLETEIEADRAAAEEELAAAKLEAKRLVADGQDRVKAGHAGLADERRALDDRAAAITAEAKALADRQAAFAKETAGLRKALAG